MESLFKIEQLDSFLTEANLLLNSLYRTNTVLGILPQSILEKAKEELKILILQSNFNFTEVSRNLQTSNFDGDKHKAFSELLDNRKKEILYQALLQSNSQFGETVSNIDWAVKLVLGTSDLKTVQYPFLQLLLSIVNADGTTKKGCYEINSDLVKKAIEVLQKFE